MPTLLLLIRKNYKMLYIKIMSGQDIHDSCNSKNYTLVTIGDRDRFQFGEWGALYGNPENPWKDDGGNTSVMIVIREGSTEQEVYCLLGNVYIMNSQGKTISTRMLHIDN